MFCKIHWFVLGHNIFKTVSKYLCKDFLENADYLNNIFKRLQAFQRFSNFLLQYI